MNANYKLSDMTKVMIISEEGRGGGPLHRILQIAQATRADIDTVVVCPENSAFHKKLDAANVKNIGIGLRPLSKHLPLLCSYVFFFVSEIWQLRKIIKQEQPDLVHVASSTQIKGLIAAKLTRTKVLWQMNDSYQPRSVELLFRLFSDWPTAYILTSHRSQKYYTKIAPRIADKPYWIMQSPVDTGSIVPVGQTRPALNRFILIGYINAHKGIELMLEAASQAPDVRIDVVGPVLESQESYFAEIQKLQSSLGVENVSFLGYQEITADFLSQYDFCLCSSLREASPTAVWECMAAGLPVVSTDVGDVHLFVEGGDCGICVQEFTGKALSEGMRQATELTPEEYSSLSTNARNVAEQNFNLQKVAKDYVSCYRSIVGEQ